MSPREDFEIALADYVYDVANNYRLCISDSRRKLNQALDALIGSGNPATSAEPVDSPGRSAAPNRRPSQETR